MSPADNPLEVFPPPQDFRSPITSVEREATYDFYGPLSPSNLAASASDFILQHCTGSRTNLVQSLSALIVDSAASAQQCTGAADRDSCINSTWLTVRITTASDEWITPRWHRDGCMFTCACVEPKPHAKYAVTLLGPPTRLLCPSEDVDAVMRMVEAKQRQKSRGADEENVDEERTELAAALEGRPLVQVGRGQIVKFTWGQEDSPVHSEPDSSAEDRVFVSVMFGSEEELRDMCQFRNQVYGKECIWLG